MRSFPCVLALALLLVPTLAAAEEGKPDPKVPLYSIEFLMPSADDVPEGWTRGGKAPAGAPKEDPLYDLAESCGLDLDTFYAELGVLAKGSATVGYAMLDVEKHVWALRAKLDAQASEKGWLLSELGSPTRLLLVGAADDLAKQAQAALTEHVVYRMAELAMDRISGRSGNEEAGREAAISYADSIRAVAKDSGVAHAILGIVHWIESRPKTRDGEPDRTIQDKALASFGKALEAGVKFPPRGSVRVFVAGQLGGILLARKDEKVLPQATRALEIAVEHERDGKNNQRRFGNRYDLACAYARAGKLDKAFGMLEKAIETGKSLPPNVWHSSYQHMREKDPDMAPLRKDPRFAELMAKHEPEQPKNPHGRMPPKDPHHKKKPDDPHHK